MAPSRMVPATLAATAIHMLYQHLWPYLTGGQGLFDGLWEDEAFATFWQTQTQAVNVMTPVDDTLTVSNGTAAAGTEPPIAALFSAAWFVELLATLAAAVAMYYWSVGLERAFPARPRGVAIAGRGGSGGIAAGGEKTGLLSEDREEEVVKQVSISRAPVAPCLPPNLPQEPLSEETSTDSQGCSGSPRAVCGARPSAGATLLPNGCSR